MQVVCERGFAFPFFLILNNFVQRGGGGKGGVFAFARLLILNNFECGSYVRQCARADANHKLLFYERKVSQYAQYRDFLIRRLV